MEDEDEDGSCDKASSWEPLVTASKQGKLKTSFSQLQATQLVQQMDKEGEKLCGRPFQHCNVDMVRIMLDFYLDHQNNTLIILLQHLQ